MHILNERARNQLVNQEKNIRILFIGFGSIPGFDSFDWKQETWLCASDYHVVFINTRTLNDLINQVKRLHPSYLSVLRNQLVQLKSEIVEIVETRRSVFVFGLEKIHWPPGAAAADQAVKPVDTYIWCPIPITTRQQQGDGFNEEVVSAFINYRKLMKKWLFTFDLTPIELNSRIDPISEEKRSLVAKFKAVFTNLSEKPLGMEARIYLQSSEPLSSGDFSDQIISETSPIYLLHHPGEDKELTGLNILLQEFYQTNIALIDDPDWLATIIPPTGATIDTELAQLDQSMQALAERKAELIQQRQEVEYWRRLIYVYDTPLEEVTMKAFKLLGLQNVQLGPKALHDIQGVFEGDHWIFECKGVTKSIGRRELNDLDRHSKEWEIEFEDMPLKKAILVGNAYRNDHPNTRGTGQRPVFPPDVISAAESPRFGHVLLDTRLLYAVVTKFLEGDETIGQRFLEAIRDTVGVVKFPID